MGISNDQRHTSQEVFRKKFPRGGVKEWDIFVKAFNAGVKYHENKRKLLWKKQFNK